jgi:Xaa-Pro dipeptidase
VVEVALGEASPAVEGLTVAGCQSRQRRLVDELQKSGADGILICDRRHVNYFSGFWAAWHHTPLMLVTAAATSHLVLPDVVECGDFVADKVSHYPTHHHGTLVDEQLGAALQPLAGEIARISQLGIDLPQLVLRLPRLMHDMSTIVLKLRRAKDQDEVELIRHAVRACEAAYARAAEILQPGIREIDVFAEMQAAAVKEAGEPLGEMGNDFQAGTLGGPPRTRPIQHGELMPLDVAVSLRGYRCDLCRTFAVGSEPTTAQLKAAELVNGAIQYVEQHVQLGGSCRELYEEMKLQLDGVNGWRFFHHLGHGTGLSAHEAPRLNSHWDDRFEMGDLFTVEPGLYHEDLRAGVRIEQNYWLSRDGLCRLSSYPTSL